MPPIGNYTTATRRLRALLDALADKDWHANTDLMAACYNDYATASARAMLNGDLRMLRALGFQIERTPGHHDPAYRLQGHDIV